MGLVCANDVSYVSTTPARGRTVEANVPPVLATFWCESLLVGPGLRKCVANRGDLSGVKNLLQGKGSMSVSGLRFRVDGKPRSYSYVLERLDSMIISKFEAHNLLFQFLRASRLFSILL